MRNRILTKLVWFSLDPHKLCSSLASCTHAGQKKRRIGGERGGQLWTALTEHCHSHSLALCCRSCCGASGCGLSSWIPPSNCHPYTSGSATCLWSPPRNATSVNKHQLQTEEKNNIPTWNLCSLFSQFLPRSRDLPGDNRNLCFVGYYFRAEQIFWYSWL